MTRFLPLVVLSLSLVGCASTAVKPTATDSKPDLRTTEVRALESRVSTLHDYSVFKDDDERLFDPNNVDEYQASFGELNCKKGISSQECAQRWDQIIFSRLSSLYFAADPVAVRSTCANEPLICFDLISFETLFRRLHNVSVEESKQEKLRQIEDWSRGKLTDEELKEALHFDFVFKAGKLIVKTPSA
jgi:hypothetical protein